MFAEDEAVMRDTEREKRWPWAILDAQKEMLTRPMPNIFTVHKVGVLARFTPLSACARPARSTERESDRQTVTESTRRLLFPGVEFAGSVFALGVYVNHAVRAICMACLQTTISGGQMLSTGMFSFYRSYFSVGAGGVTNVRQSSPPLKYPRSPQPSNVVTPRAGRPAHARFPQGEFWVMLHRSFAEYVHKSPDNQARMLLAYFSGMMVRSLQCRLLCLVVCRLLSI